MAVSKRLRYEVLRRDNHACRYCGASAPDVKLTVDHVVPVALGGKDEASNLVCACQPCNAGKSSSAPDATLVDDVSADAVRWARARHAALEEWRAERDQGADDVAAFDGFWLDYQVAGRTLPRAPDWEATVRLFLREGLTLEDLDKLLASTMGRQKYANGHRIAVDERWRYFCGAVWRTLKDIDQRTGEAVSAAPADREVPGGLTGGLTGERAGAHEGLAWDERMYEANEVGHSDGFKDALDTLIRWAEERVDRKQGPCGDCGEHTEFETSGRCLWCWRRALDPAHGECPDCFRLKKVGEECPHPPAYVPPMTRGGICPMCNEPLELPLDECPTCGFEIPWPSNAPLVPCVSCDRLLSPGDSCTNCEGRPDPEHPLILETFPPADPRWS